MGRGMLLNVVKKTNAEIVSIHDISDKNINEFMDSLSSAEQAKVRVCGSPADVRRYPCILLNLHSSTLHVFQLLTLHIILLSSCRLRLERFDFLPTLY